MPKRLTRRQRTADNGERLFAAARAVLTKNGYHRASLDQVARAAGLTKGAVYSRFTSKSALMLALLERRIDERIAQFEAAVAAPATRTREAVSALARQWADLVSADRAWSLLVLEFRCHAARDRALNARFAAVHGRLRDGLARAFARTAGVPPLPPEDLARLAFALSNGFALEVAAEGDACSPALYERGAVALVRGLGARSRRRR